MRRYIKEQEAADRRRRCLIRRIGPIPYLLRNRRIDRPNQVRTFVRRRWLSTARQRSSTPIRELNLVVPILLDRRATGLGELHEVC